MSDGRCQNPHPIEFYFGFYDLSGTTVVDSVNSVDKPRCDTSTTGKDTVEWFSFEGNGHSIYLDTCGSDFDTIINVFTGSCYDLNCVIWNDDSSYCGYASMASFCTEVGKTYLIGIGGFGLDTGNFYLAAYDLGECVQESTCQDVVTALPTSYITNGDLTILDSVQLSVENCGSAPLGSRNAWFAIFGEDAMIYVDTCDSCFDTVLTVYESFGSCNDMRCIAYNDDAYYGECFEYSPNLCDNYFTSATSFCSASGSVYYIAVGGYGGDTGLVTLSVSVGDPCLSNDDCEFAKRVEIDEFVIVDTTYGYNYNTVTCNGIEEGYGSGWYMLEGTGSAFEVNIVGGSLQTDLLVISSNSGSCNEEQICIEGQFINPYESLIFCTDPDKTYWISFGGEYYIGLIGFVISEAGGCVAPDNDICADATFVDASLQEKLFTGTTEYAGGELSSFTCGSVTFYPPSYSWYKVVGNGRQISVSTCGSDFDTIIGVFESSCDFYSCVTSNDDSCGTQSSLQFCALLDVEYYIIIGGYNADFGNYHLIIDELNRCTGNDVCSASESIEVPTILYGSTLTASIIDTHYYQVPFDCVDEGSGFINTQWYTFQSTESRMIEIWGGYSDIQVVFGVYEANCAIKRTSCAPFVSTTGISYWINICGAYYDDIYLMVAGNNDERGSYRIDINYLDETCTLALPASSCDSQNLNYIESVPHTIYGDSSEGIAFFSYQCEADFYTSDIVMAGHSWYTVDGTGYNIEISACDSDPNMGISFVIFGDCAPTECLAASNNGECSVSWCSVPGETYYIKMGSYGSHITGEYKITLRNTDVCVSYPYGPFIFAREKTTTSILFEWTEPYSYGFPVLDYTWEFYDSNFDFITSGVVVEPTVLLDDLTPNSQFYINVYARNQWGNGNYAYGNERTLAGTCLMDPVSYDVAVWNRQNIYDLYFYGNYLTPSGDGIIHTIDLQLGYLEENSYAFIYLFENTYGIDDYFSLKYWKGYVFEGRYYNYRTFGFSDLEWSICNNKRYLIASIVSGEVLQSPDTWSESTCVGDITGFTLDAYFLNQFREDIWYEDLLASEIFQIRVDADMTTPIQSDPPSSPDIDGFFTSVTSVTIYWFEACSNSEITGYHIQITPGFQQITVDSSQREVSFYNLLPNAIYEIEIRALNQHGESEPTSQEIVTLRDRFSIQWLSQSSNSVGNIVPTSTAVDSNGNSYVTGYFDNVSTFGDFTLEAQLFVTDSFLVKYNSIGEPLWVVHIGRSTTGYQQNLHYQQL